VINRRRRIFISYASADGEVANRLVECLRLKNKDVWFDQIEIVWGDQIVSEINRGLSNSFMGIVILVIIFLAERCPS
jgi:hypothetical protein